MTYLGVDIGTKQTGISVIRDNKKIVTHLIKGNGTKSRVQQLSKEICEIIIKYNPDIIVFEKPFNVKGYALILLELLGAIKFGLWACDPRILDITYEVPQTTIKKFATGRGNAQKSDMGIEAAKEFKLKNRSEDEIDAFWIALFGKYILKMPLRAKKYRRIIIRDYLKKLK